MKKKKSKETTSDGSNNATESTIKKEKKASSPASASTTSSSWRYVAFMVLGVSALIALLLGTSDYNKYFPFPTKENTTVRPLSMWWMAPFFSGGGYCSEAIDFARALSLHSKIPLKIVQHGDSVNEEFVEGLDMPLRQFLVGLHEKDIPPAESVVVCHSEPGAWDPPMYRILPCPPKSAAYKIGRTMFETDRIPKGWEARCNKMDEIWVPTEFHKHTFSKYLFIPLSGRCKREERL